MKQFYETYCDADEKLSPVVREIAPEAEQVFRDQYVLEFLGGKEYEHENSMKKALLQQKLRDIYESSNEGEE
jgi:predicted nuclease of restriction endonuclease-like (RecB) superfamily